MTNEQIQARVIISQFPTLERYLEGMKSGSNEKSFNSNKKTYTKAYNKHRKTYDKAVAKGVFCGF